jgi:hypothetical protein
MPNPGRIRNLWWAAFLSADKLSNIQLFYVSPMLAVMPLYQAKQLKIDHRRHKPG